jgi:hypothetical protein
VALKIVKPSSSSSPRPPRKLGKPGNDLWQSINAAYDISDAGGIEMLVQACLTQDRVEQCATQIETDGPVILIKGVLREHPLLRAELAGRTFVVRTLQRLGLDVEVIKPVGRPPGRSPPNREE